MTPKQSTPKPEDLISFDEAAELLGQTRRTVKRMVDRGELKSYTRLMTGRKGRKPVLVDRREVQQLKEAVVEVKPD